MIEETPIQTASEEEKIVVSYKPPKEKTPLVPQIISIILHPMLMGVYMISLLFVYTDFNLLFSGQYIRFISPVLFLTCIVPVSGLYFLQKSRPLRDPAQTTTFDKLMPMLVVFFAYSLLIYYFHSAKLFIWFLSLLAVPLVLIVIYILIGLKWKISLHMLAIGGLIGSTLSVCYNIKGVNPFVLFIILFILAGCLGVARLVLKKETPTQVYIGFLIGVVVAYLCIYIGLKWEIMMLLKKF